jgi:hypothetical protein
MGATAAAVIMHREREIVAAFLRSAATAPDRARRPSELGIEGGVALRRLRARAVLREAAPGELYLDEPTWIALRRLRRRVAMIVLLLLAVALVLGMLRLPALVAH